MTTIVTRAGKASPLTNAEVDANFSNLNDFKVEQTSATGAAQLPSGSTAQRPGTPAAGYIRYNATTGKFEGYGSAWGNIGGGAFIGDTAPANPGSGDLWWNSATGHTFVFYGSAWVDLFGGAEGQYLPLTGGTISGNVGVGATLNTWASSRKVLQVGGSASLVANSSGSGFVFLGNNWFLDANSANAYINTAAASRFDLASDGSFRWNIAPSGTAGNAISFTQQMTLDASGNLVLATTAAQGSALGTFGPSGRNANGVFIGGYSNNNMLVLDSTYNQSTAVRFVRGATLVGYIGFTDAGTTYGTSSDQRLKTNVNPAGSAIQSILDFPIDQFDWISTGKHQDFGAIAQKAFNAIPEMVSVPADENEMWSIDWSKANPRLIRAFQELEARVKTLEARVH